MRDREPTELVRLLVLDLREKVKPTLIKKKKHIYNKLGLNLKLTETLWLFVCSLMRDMAGAGVEEVRTI